MKIGIIGTGVFGISIASILHKNGHNLCMWTAFKEEKEDLEKNKVRENLGNYKIPDEIHFTNDIKDVCVDKDLIFIVVPAQFVSQTILKTVPYIKDQHICIASKGIEESTSMFLPDIVKNILNTNRIGVISGPSFAIDIVNNVPIGLSLASYNPKTSDIIYKALENDFIKMFKTNDVIGTCLCGAVKNVLAIASGIISGLDFPISTQAMLITQSLHDVEELITNLGGNPRTILSFAGFGDIILTCTSEKSRNYSFGQLIGKGNRIKIKEYMNKNTIEGLTALRSIHSIINNKKIDIPIIRLIYDIVYNEKDCKNIINFLTK